MTKTIAILALASCVVAESAAFAQSDSAAPSNAVSSGINIRRPTSPTMRGASLSMQTGGSSGELQEIVPMAKTIDNDVNNPPVSGSRPAGSAFSTTKK